MQDAEKSLEMDETPSAIVCIAYSQLSLMLGVDDLTKAPTLNGTQVLHNEDKNMICTKRLLRLPIFASITSTFSYIYTSTKNSHESINTFFNNIEDTVGDACNYVSPVTDKVCTTLEKPLKTVDNAVCTSLDFVEEKVPSIKLPPIKMYDGIKNYIREEVIAPVIQIWCSTMKRFKELAITYELIEQKSDGNKKDLGATDK